MQNGLAYPLNTFFLEFDPFKRAETFCKLQRFIGANFFIALEWSNLQKNKYKHFCKLHRFTIANFLFVCSGMV